MDPVVEEQWARLKKLQDIDCPSWAEVVELTLLVHEIERRRKP